MSKNAMYPLTVVLFIVSVYLDLFSTYFAIHSADNIGESNPLLKDRMVNGFKVADVASFFYPIIVGLIFLLGVHYKCDPNGDKKGALVTVVFMLFVVAFSSGVVKLVASFQNTLLGLYGVNLSELIRRATGIYDPFFAHLISLAIGLAVSYALYRITFCKFKPD